MFLKPYFFDQFLLKVLFAQLSYYVTVVDAGENIVALEDVGIGFKFLKIYISFSSSFWDILDLVEAILMTLIATCLPVFTLIPQ